MKLEILSRRMIKGKGEGGVAVYIVLIVVLMSE